MKFILFVEGHTEGKALPHFFKRWLDPRLARKAGVQCERFDGWPELVKDSRLKAERYFHHPKGDVIAVIALLDLYGPTFYPSQKITTKERLDWAKAHLETQVNDPRFRQHFAVHEVEAWLLSSPTIFPEAVANALPGKVSQPETVNFDEPPKALLARLYREKMKRNYKAVVDGNKLFEKLDPQIAYAKCPQLKLLLDDMLTLAQQAQAGEM